jgi:hypothetical protein
MIASGGCLGPHTERIPHELLSEMLDDVLGFAYAQVLAIAIARGSKGETNTWSVRSGATEKRLL